MHAIRQYEFGPPETLRYERIDDPVPGSGEVRIAVEVSGVHFVDTMIRRGVDGGPFPLPTLPMVPGREVAGVVDDVGPGADPNLVGRPVAAHLGPASGGYAERALAAADSLLAVPDSLDTATALAMIGTGRTAVGILDIAALTPDDVVVVTAAAGGLGSLFVQAAARAGAEVIGLAGGQAKVRLVRRLGASAAIDYLRSDWPAQTRTALAGRAVTVVLDGVGGDAGRAAAGLLGSGGRLVLFGRSSGAQAPLDEHELAARGVSVSWGIGPQVAQRPGGLRGLQERALATAAAGQWTPLIQSFPLAEAARAHAALEGRGTTGKVVLVP